MSLSGSLRGIGLVFGLSLCLMVVGCGSGMIPTSAATGGGSSTSGSGNSTAGGGTSTTGSGTSSTGSGTSSTGSGTSSTGGGTSGGGTTTGGGGASPGSGTSGTGGGTSGSGGGTSGGGGTPVPGASLSGRVNGGEQAIAGSNVYLYAAGTGGYGTGATSLLGGSGYVTTDATGVFGLGAYTCPTANSQLYLIATGGNPGAGENNQAVLMVALGSCGSIGPSSFININEVSSVASVYALSQFMVPGSTAVGTSSTNVQGLVNAFNTAGQSGGCHVGLGANDDSGGQWDCARVHDQHAGEYFGGVREYRRGNCGVLELICCCDSAGRYGAGRYVVSDD